MDIHNKFRLIHDAEPLKESKDLTKEAQEHAEKAAKDGKLEPSDTNDGENLAMKCSKKEMAADEAVIHWYISPLVPGVH